VERVKPYWPQLAAWAVLALGCIALLVYEARDVGLTAGNWAALIIATIAVTGLCIWIISWEDKDEIEPSKKETPSAEPPDA
jgi:hypothetical protein